MQRHLAPLADPRRRVGLRARVCYAREDGGRSRAWPSDGCARWVRPSAPAALARGPLELDPPRQAGVGALSLLGAWVRPACARYAPTSRLCAHTARIAGRTSCGTSGGGFARLCVARAALFTLHTLWLWLCACVHRMAVCKARPTPSLSMGLHVTPYSTPPKKVNSNFYLPW